jgi:Fe-S cluster biosynthesis and repair protein YggX
MQINYVFLKWRGKNVCVVYGNDGEMRPACEEAWEVWQKHFQKLPEVFLLEENPALQDYDKNKEYLRGTESEWVWEKSNAHGIPIEFAILDPYSEKSFRIVEQKFPHEKQKYIELMLLENLSICFYLAKKKAAQFYGVDENEEGLWIMPLEWSAWMDEEKIAKQLNHIAKEDIKKAKRKLEQFIFKERGRVVTLKQLDELREKEGYLDLDRRVLQELHSASRANVERVLQSYNSAFAVVGFMHTPIFGASISYVPYKGAKKLFYIDWSKAK